MSSRNVAAAVSLALSLLSACSTNEPKVQVEGRASAMSWPSWNGRVKTFKSASTSDDVAVVFSFSPATDRLDISFLDKEFFNPQIGGREALYFSDPDNFSIAVEGCTRDGCPSPDEPYDCSDEARTTLNMNVLDPCTSALASRTKRKVKTLKMGSINELVRDMFARSELTRASLASALKAKVTERQAVERKQQEEQRQADLAAEQEHRVQEAHRAAEAAHVANIKSGAAPILTYGDARLRYSPDTRANEIVERPMLKPNGRVYEGSCIADGQFEEAVLICKNALDTDYTHKQFLVNIGGNPKSFGQGIRLQSFFRFIGKYSRNRDVRTVLGNPVTVPVFDAIYLETD